jgi:hypothetical protein
MTISVIYYIAYLTVILVFAEIILLPTITKLKNRGHK